jgi:segregation and condensation protein B
MNDDMTDPAETAAAEIDSVETEPAETDPVGTDAAETDDATPAPAPAESDLHAEQLRLLEALLFASAAPLDEASIAQRLPKGSDVAALIAELGEHYSGRGVNVVNVAGGWTLRTAPDLGPRLKLEQTVTRKLSRAAIETLAIIAYHQPVTRGEIEEIRGVVVSSGTLDVLMEAGWIAPKGRRETPGRPVTWVTTDEFLTHFGLADRRDLPGLEELKAAGLVGPRPDFVLSEQAVQSAAPTEENEDDDEDDEEPLFDEERSAEG